MTYHKPYDTTKRTGTGGRKGKRSDKRLAHVGSLPTYPTVSDKDVRKVVRVRGGNKKVRQKKVAYVNVVDESGKAVRTKIIKVIDSNNPDFVRGNVITKGAIVQTEKFPRVRITSRPSQCGITNGIVVN